MLEVDQVITLKFLMILIGAQVLNFMMDLKQHMIGFIIKLSQAKIQKNLQKVINIIFFFKTK